LQAANSRFLSAHVNEQTGRSPRPVLSFADGYARDFHPVLRIAEEDQPN